MISIIVPTLNAETDLAHALRSLVDANNRGVVKEVIVSDGGSEDQTLLVAEEAGARIVRGPKGRGAQLRAGADIARGPWLMFLHADTQLSLGWERAALRHIHAAHDRQAAVFKLKFDADGIRPNLVAMGANIRTRMMCLPYGDQGMLISRRHYDRIGGFSALPLFEDVDLVRRIVRADDRRALKMLPVTALTSATRYEQDGYFKRVVDNFRCLRMYFAGVPVDQITEIYNGRHRKGLPAKAHHDGKAAAHGEGQDEA